ncbi:uncharacterized protein LOC134686719 [Mytilus trossulus]|uniref:uncharacterized protein LOC134686719 n=1 Tax=Mytilus trossulus TaxID=6551 RepID=UPI003004ED32
MTFEGSSSKTMTDVERVLTWADAKKLSEATANAVISLGFDSMEALALLEGEDLQKTKIPIGQQKLLLKSIRQSCKAETENAPKGSNGGLPACPTSEDACAPEVTDIQDGGNNNNNNLTSGLTDTCVGNVLNQLQQQQAASGVINQGIPSAGQVQELDSLVLFFQSRMFADSTKKTYMLYFRSYESFCRGLLIPMVPISKDNLARYIVFLTQRLCYNSVVNYLNIVRLLHEEAELPYPIDTHFVKGVLKGVKRVLGAEKRPKLPITPKILSGIFTTIDLNESLDITFWAACLVAFFPFSGNQTFLHHLYRNLILIGI